MNQVAKHDQHGEACRRQTHPLGGHRGGEPEYDPQADFDGDDTVTFADYQMWLQYYRDAIGDPEAPAPLPVPGDANRDGEVDP